MTVSRLEIPGLILITPDIFCDHRGCFLETYQKDKYKDILETDAQFIQDNMSFSLYGTIRGLHFQREPFGQAKLVRCTYGRILDIAVDIRPNSVFYGEYTSVELTGEEGKQLYIPQGFAHGFCVLSPEAVVEYKCDAYYNSRADAGIRFNDADLNINWQIPYDVAIVSEKDLNLPFFSELCKGKTK